MNQRVKLSIVGISFSQVQESAYALVFAEINGPRKLPIVVGMPEAQSIAMVIEKIIPPRPLTHDLMASTFRALHIDLLDVYIYKFEDGAFHAELTLQQGENQYKIDSRTSDGVALAVRTGADIYTTEEIMRDMSVVFDNEGDEHIGMKNFISNEEKELSQLSIETLNTLLNEALKKEDFESAISLRDEMNKRKE